MLTTCTGSNLLVEFKLLWWVSMWSVCNHFKKWRGIGSDWPSTAWLWGYILKREGCSKQQVKSDSLRLPWHDLRSRLWKTRMQREELQILIYHLCACILLGSAVWNSFYVYHQGYTSVGEWTPLLVVEILNKFCSFYKLTLCPTAPHERDLEGLTRFFAAAVPWVSSAHKWRVTFSTQILFFLLCIQVGQDIFFLQHYNLNSNV